MEYLIYFEGLGIEKWIEADSEKAAYLAAWQSLSDEDADKTVIMDCIDRRESHPLINCLVKAGENTYEGKFADTIAATMDAMDRYPEAERISVQVIL